MQKEEATRVTVSLPQNLKEWIERCAVENLSSMSQEIARTIKARMEAEQKRTAA